MQNSSSNGQRALFVAASVVLGIAILFLAPMVGKNPYFLLGIPFVCALLFILFWNARYFVLILLFTRALMDPVFGTTQLGGGLGIGGLLNLLVIGTTVMLIARFPKSFIDDNFLLTRWAAYLTICAFTVLYAPYLQSSIKTILHQSTYLCMMLLGYFLTKGESDRRFWVRCMLLSAVIPVIFADIGFVTHHRILFRFNRLQGTFTHPNILAFYLVLTVALAFVAWKKKWTPQSPAGKALFFMFVFNVFFLLIVTKTRSAWISCWAFFFLYGLLRERKYVAICVIAPLALLSLPVVRQRIDDLTKQTGDISSAKLNSMAWRFKLWRSSLPLIRERFLFGHGVGSFEFLSLTFFSQEKKGTSAHNVYLQLLFETGFFGLFAYVTMYLRLLVRMLRNWRSRESSVETAVYIAYVVSYLLVGYSDNVLHFLAFNWYYWFLIGLVVKMLALDSARAKAAV